jgi:hypothetical protein
MFRPLSGHPQAKQITITRNYIGQCLQFFKHMQHEEIQNLTIKILWLFNGLLKQY